MYPTSVHRINEVLSVYSNLLGVGYLLRACVIVYAERLSVSGEKNTSAAGEPVSKNVVMRLVEPCVGNGRNCTMDNFFTSLSLANKLLAKKTTWPAL
jgi:hypothetical protein